MPFKGVSWHQQIKKNAARDLFFLMKTTWRLKRHTKLCSTIIRNRENKVNRYDFVRLTAQRLETS